MRNEWLLKQLSIFRPARHVGNPRFIIFGIGNIGKTYQGTRHNIGFEVVEHLCAKLDSPRILYKFNNRIIGGALCNVDVVLVQPQTYVNRCGPALKALCNAYQVPESSCLVIVDDFNLALGSIRMRRSGTHGGHNGLKSIIAAIGNDFPRLRVGIGPLPPQEPVIDFVLGRFSNDQYAVIQNACMRAGDAVAAFITDGAEKAMSRFNKD